MGLSPISTTGVYNNLQHSLLKEDEIWTVISKKDLIADEWASQFKSFLHASHKIIDFTQTSSCTEFPHKELSLLGWASLNGHTAIVELIIEHAPLSQDIINQQMTKNITPLGLACAIGHSEIVTLLLDAGARLDCLTTDGFRPLGLAVFSGRTSTVQAILEHPSFTNDSSHIDAHNGPHKMTALHLACKTGHSEIVTLLLDARAKLDVLTTHGTQPLSLAVKYHHIKTAQAVLEHPSFTSNSSYIDDLNVPYNMTALHLACRIGDSEIATLLLDAGARLDRLTTDGSRPLGIAAKYGYINAVQIILEHPSFTNDSSHIDAHNGLYKMTALHLACKEGHHEIVKLLLDAGAKLNALTTDNVWPLGLAADSGHINAVQAILDHPSFTNDSSHIDTFNGPHKMTALHIACTRGDSEIVKLLLDAGASLDSLTTDNFRPLGTAANQGHINAVQAILDHPSFKNDSSHIDALNGSREMTALDTACTRGDSEIIKLLLNAGAQLTYLDPNRYTPLSHATYHSRTNAVQAILEHSSFKSDQSFHINTPNGLLKETSLHIACTRGDSEIVKLLLDAGASLDSLTTDNFRPLGTAANQGQINAVQAILDHPSFKNDPSHIDALNGSHKMTALDTACTRGDSEIIKLLLNAGAQLTYLDPKRYTPLSHATYHSRTNAVQAILEHSSFKSDQSCHINTPNGLLKETSLHIACALGHSEIVKLLLDAGAELECLTTERYRPLSLAAYYGHTGTVRAILEHPSFKSDSSHIDDPNGADNMTVLHIACTKGHAEIVTLLLDAGASLLCTTRNGLSAFEIAQRHSNLSHIIFFHLTGGEGNVESFVSELDKELVSLKKRIQNQEAIDLKQLFKSIQSAYEVCLAITMPQPPFIPPSLVTSLKKLLKQDRFCSTLQNQVKQLESSRGKTNANLEKVLENALFFKNQLLGLYNIITNLIQDRSRKETFRNNIKILNNQLDNIMQKARNTLATSKLQTLDGFQSQFNDADVFSLLTEWNIGVAHVAASNQMASSSAASSQGSAVVNLNPMESITNHLGIEGGQDLWACGLMEGKDLRAIGIDLDIKYYCEQWPHRRTDPDFIAEMISLLKNKTLLWDAILGANNISSVETFMLQLESGKQELDARHLIQAYKNNSLSLLIAFLSKKEKTIKNLKENFQDLSLSEISIQTTWVPLELYQNLTVEQTDNPSKRQKR